MEKDLPKYRLKDETIGIPLEYQHSFELPDQGVELTSNGHAYVWLSKDLRLEVEYDLARFIAFALKLKFRELRLGFGREENKSDKKSITKTLIELSNCHRTLLAIIGFQFADLVENNAGGDIIDNFFLSNPEIQTRAVTRFNIFSELNKTDQQDFPLVANIFVNQNDKSSSQSRHSFLVLGKTQEGEYICFHKNGIGENNPVELTSLNQIIKTDLSQYDTDRFCTLAPISNVDQYYEKMVNFARMNLEK